MSLIEISGLAATLLMLAFTLKQYRKGKLNKVMTITFILACLLIGGFIIFPDLYSVAGKILGVNRPLDFIMLLSIMAVYVLVFEILYTINAQQRDITKTIREISIMQEGNEYIIRCFCKSCKHHDKKYDECNRKRAFMAISEDNRCTDYELSDAFQP